ncbi:hypothetical protein TorRG33x02_175670 [Trema orientale]|uniref:Uncharacterized protein n=1 Tax=Trema orientale TaxID=63057 RepID=A0A2P5EM65_TREOI|nr:hypothetical protein TorRG33x02_175670 [Trema orientale]
MALELPKSTHFSYTRSSSIAQIYAGHKKSSFKTHCNNSSGSYRLIDSLHQFLGVMSVNL